LSDLLADDRLASIRLVAVLKENHVNKRDKTCEGELFQSYFPRGEIFVDEEKRFYSALKGRSLFSFFSKRGWSYVSQRLGGVSEKGVKGNMNGALKDPFLLGGTLLIAPSGRVTWAHAEGDGPIDYAELKAVLLELAASVGNVSPAMESSEDTDWFKSAMDNWDSFFR